MVFLIKQALFIALVPFYKPKYTTYLPDNQINIYVF